jgi:hypothetical protein
MMFRRKGNGGRMVLVDEVWEDEKREGRGVPSAQAEKTLFALAWAESARAQASEHSRQSLTTRHTAAAQPNPAVMPRWLDRKQPSSSVRPGFRAPFWPWAVLASPAASTFLPPMVKILKERMGKVRRIDLRAYRTLGT